MCSNASHLKIAENQDFQPDDAWVTHSLLKNRIESNKMVLPKVNKCCFIVPLEAGGVAFLLISLMWCVGALAFCSVMLPSHSEQQNEDNVVLLSMTMFATLSALSNIVALAGIAMRRPSFLQMFLMTNPVFILCILLVCTVTLLFSPWLREHWLYVDNSPSPGNIVIAVFLLVFGALYALYHLTIVNSLYTKMKMTYGDSAIPYSV